MSSGGPPYYGRWSVSDVYQAVLDGTWVEATPPSYYSLITPSSITYTGTSASIVGFGSVEFTSCTSVSLNGVFSSDFDNYQILINSKNSSTSATGILFRLRASGSDATSPNYITTWLEANNTTVSAYKFAATTQGYLGYDTLNNTNGVICSIYGPHLSQQTIVRSYGSVGAGTVYMPDTISIHGVSSQYDGITIINGTRTGSIAVYGLGGQ